MRHSRKRLCLTLFLLSPASAIASTLTFESIQADASECFSGTLANREVFLQTAAAGTPFLAAHPDELARHGEWYDAVRAEFERVRDEYECRLFEYAVDGLTVQGFYVKPRVVDNELPVIVYNRGGNAMSGPRLLSPAGLGKIVRVAQRGFIVIGSLYRGGRIDGSAHPDRDKDEFGGRDVNDVLALLDIVDSMPGADSERIGIWGFSRGGMMAYLAARRSDRFMALVAESAATDLAGELAFRPEMERVMETWIPDYRENRAVALRERSAVAWAEALPEDMPILILQGSADWRVYPQSALEMATKLQDLKRPYRLVMFEGGDHGGAVHYEEVVAQIAGWFERQLVRENVAQK